MNKFCLIGLYILISLPALAQSEQSQAVFSYQKNVSLMGTVIDAGIEDLFYNGTASVYIQYAKKAQSASEPQTIVKGDTRITLDRHDPTDDGKDFIIYQNYKTKVLVNRTAFSNGKRCVVQDSIPVFDWKLEPEKKRIGAYDCQKATTTFRCAKYTVWFTTEIPVSIGPAKLGGLPGLIVEATNERAEATYKLIVANYPVSTKTYKIAPPDMGDPVYTYEAYRKIEIVEQDKMLKFLSSSADAIPGTKPIINFPECLDGK
ncbi:GLPGLI family protein [Spirosoma sp. SC4-14]|uniref:GLPGLI family protein n=1 Tax=Spirosoma sp. SC4-14 TaxID=3128900 RepID=UPI0030CC4766